MKLLIPVWIISAALILPSSKTYSQKGSFYTTHYTTPSEVAGTENSAIVQDNYGNMMFANAKGVLKFDGKNWDLIRTGSTVLHLQFDESENILYVACLDGVGRLQVQPDGTFAFQSFYKQVDKFGYYSKIILTGSKVYFQGAEEIIEWDKKSRRITQNIPEKVDVAFKYEDKLFACYADSSIKSLNGKKFIPIKQKLTCRARYAKSINTKQSVIIGRDNHLYLFYGSFIEKMPFSDSVYIKNAIPFDAVLLNNQSTLAIATLKGGCLIADVNNFTTQSTINYYTGMPDNEIYAIGKDAQYGLWLAHEKGFTRVDYFLPFKNYAYYPGLEGNLLAAITYLSKLYVGTNEGLYYLDKVENMAEIAKVVKKKPKEKATELENNAAYGTTLQERKKESSKLRKTIMSLFKKDDSKLLENTQNQTFTGKSGVSASATDTITKRKKSFFSFLKRKNKGSGSQDKDVNQPNVPNASSNTSKTANIEPISRPNTKITIKKAIQSSAITPDYRGDMSLWSLKYMFKKISGVEGKCKQLLVHEQQLLAATNMGLYVVNGTESALISKIGITQIIVHENILYAATDDNRLLIFTLNQKKWLLLSTIEDLPEKVFSFYVDNDNSVWCVGTHSMWSINQNNELVGAVGFYNSYSDKAYVFQKNKKTYVVIDKIIYAYKSGQESIQPDSLLSSAYNIQKVISANGKNIWAIRNGSWQNIGTDTLNSQNIIYLNLIKDIEYIHINSNRKNGWIITQNNELIEFEIGRTLPNTLTGNIYLQQIIDQTGNKLPINDIKLDQQSDNIQFTFITPEYLDNNALKYQYLLAGLTKEWSAWDTENKVTFSYLPAGKYTLLVRTKNALNQISESEPYIFEVKPPFWLEWWFFLAEFIFFGTLLAGSIYLNNSTHGVKYFWLSKGLTFLTIVMMIEFVSTVLESYFDVKDNPVANFGVQVILAILIFPFERILNKLITQTPKVAMPKVQKTK